MPTLPSQAPPSGTPATCPTEAGRAGVPRRALIASAGALLASARARRASAGPIAPTQPTPTPAPAPPPPPPPTWDYSPAHGPAHWSDAFPTCGSGQFQAPINLVEPFTPYAAPGGAALVRPAYRPAPFAARDSGTTARWEVGAVLEADAATGGTSIRALSASDASLAAPAGGLRVGRAVWPLVQIHFHSPGEEAVGGVRAPLGAHLVHTPPPAPLAPSDAAAAALLGGTLAPPKTIVVTILFDAPADARPHPALVRTGGGGGEREREREREEGEKRERRGSVCVLALPLVTATRKERRERERRERENGPLDKAGALSPPSHPTTPPHLLHSPQATLFACLPGLREGSDTPPTPVPSTLPSFDPATLLPPSGRIDAPYGGAWAYAGSLTTPPCGEGVTFVVARRREAASPDQAAALCRVGGWPPNARPLQPRHGRPVIVV